MAYADGQLASKACNSLTSILTMSRPFLSRSAIVDIIKSKERTNAIQKREGQTDRPVRFTVCGCPYPNCGGWHTIETDRFTPSSEECAAIIKVDNSTRKRKKSNP
jgi:hypothetical protein